MLNGQTALIVEGEFLIALDIQRMLESLGIKHTLFARDAAEAEALHPHWQDLAIAIVEIRSNEPAIEALAVALHDARIPIAFITADLEARHGIASLPDSPVALKPVSEETLADAVGQALASRPRKNDCSS